MLMWPSCVHVFASLCIGGCKKAGAPGFKPCQHWLVCAATNGILACWATSLPSASDMCEGSRTRFLRWCLQSHICSYSRITAGFDFNVNVVVDRIVLVSLGSKVPGWRSWWSPTAGAAGGRTCRQFSINRLPGSECFRSLHELHAYMWTWTADRTDPPHWLRAGAPGLYWRAEREILWTTEQNLVHLE